MTAQRIIRPATAFTLSSGKKRPREHNDAHLKCVRQLPCLGCGTRAHIEAAHIRVGSRQFGKRETGGQEKPSDQWTLPLCEGCHRTDRDSQHSGNELAFYEQRGLNPFVIALALWAATGDIERMELVIIEARQNARRGK